MSSVQIAVAEKISNLAPVIESKVIDVLVGRETEKRSTALVQVIDKLEAAEKDLKKINRPEVTAWDAEGKPLPGIFTKTQMDNINKAKQKIAKHTAAITKALENNDYADVYKLASGKDTDSGGNKSEGTVAGSDTE